MAFFEHLRETFLDTKPGTPKKFIVLNQEGDVFTGDTRLDKNGQEIGRFTFAFSQSFFHASEQAIASVAKKLNLTEEDLKKRLQDHQTIYY